MPFCIEYLYTTFLFCTQKPAVLSTKPPAFSFFLKTYALKNRKNIQKEYKNRKNPLTIESICIKIVKCLIMDTYTPFVQFNF